MIPSTANSYKESGALLRPIHLILDELMSVLNSPQVRRSPNVRSYPIEGTPVSGFDRPRLFLGFKSALALFHRNLLGDPLCVLSISFGH